MTNIKVNNLGIKYDEWLFQELSFELNSGDWLTLIGKSGSGKSNVLKSIARLLNPTKGEIYLDNKNKNEYDISVYRQNISYVTQSTNLFGDTVKDNLDLPYIIRNKEINIEDQYNGLKMIGLDNNFLDRNINTLSGGEKQRIGLLRNILFPPKALLLDEISTGLDEDTKKIIWDIILRINKEHNTIILSVTHDEKEIDNANKIMLIENKKGEFK